MKLLAIASGLIIIFLVGKGAYNGAEKIMKSKKAKSSSASETVVSLSPTSQPEKENPILADFRYPQAETVSLSGQSMSLKSRQSAEAITAWYKTRITDMNMNMRNFIQTNTNGNIANQLTGSKDKGKIKVEIDKKPDSSEVQILITISGFE